MKSKKVIATMILASVLSIGVPTVVDTVTAMFNDVVVEAYSNRQISDREATTWLCRNQDKISEMLLDYKSAKSKMYKRSDADFQVYCPYEDSVARPSEQVVIWNQIPELRNLEQISVAGQVLGYTDGKTFYVVVSSKYSKSTNSYKIELESYDRLVNHRVKYNTPEFVAFMRYNEDLVEKAKELI